MAYGARLESVLGASPRGFESPILRHSTPEPTQAPGFCRPWRPANWAAAYRSGCVGFWAVFRCYKAERWGLDSL